MLETSSAKIFSYRESTKALYKLAVAVTLVAELIIVRIRVVEFMDEETWWAIWKLILASGIPLSILIRLFFFIRPRIFSVYELRSDRLIRIYGKKREEIKFSEILSVRISLLSPRFFGGFSIQMRSGFKLRFLSALKDSHEILEAIVMARPELLPQGRYESYVRISRLVDLSWIRTKEKLKKWNILLVKYLALPIVIATILFYQGVGFEADGEPFASWFRNVLFSIVAISILGGVINHLEEKAILNSAQWGSDERKVVRDLAFEKKCSYLANVLYVGLIGLFLFLILR